ncbi:hypothetical protein HHI36_001147 [Cryptolaemus montrouzieri]|uniref:Reverse transcriptase domain-containing protein n=1 Tax=Cryptolaemus montrouzieri TaxID=559131 RepID=A0ABD2P6R1_9CUCU
MGSSLSPVVTNLFMTYFEQSALQNATFKPKLWLRYVDGIFVIWSHGEVHLMDFLDYLNSKHNRIRFTIELEENNKLPFLDVLVTKSQNRLRHAVYRKPTHTNRYLNARSHHHPTQIQGVANTIEKPLLRQTTTHPQPPPTSENRKTTYLPYIKGTMDRIGRILRKHDILTTYTPHITIGASLRNPKDKVKLENQGVYSISCGACQAKYVGQTNRKMSARLNEHKLSIKNKQMTSALFQHHINTGHKINFDSCKQIANINHFKTRTWKSLLKKDTTHNATNNAEHRNNNSTHNPEEAGPTPPNPERRYNLRPRRGLNTVNNI